MSSINTDKDGNAHVKGTYQKVGHNDATVAVIATVDGSDAGTTQTLANATKAKLNALITELGAKGLIKIS